MVNDFVHTFLFRNSKILKTEQKIAAPLDMDVDKEGWVGIPHGGIGMGAMMELASGFEHCTAKGDFRYPVECSFRMGGSEVKVGDQVTVEAGKTESGISGSIRLEGAVMPYITGEIGFGAASSPGDNYNRDYIPKRFSEIEGRLEHVPYYRNCFVCGVERSVPGLKRRFHLWNSPQGNIACAFTGFNLEDKETVHLFCRNEYLHPIVPLAILDETMGWGGFVAFAHGGVSVRLNYRLLRKIGVNEKVVFFGRGEQVKGNIDKRMFFWASGCGAVMNEDGTLDVVMVSSGQWYAMKALTTQMKNELIPNVQTEKIFAIAENQEG